MDPHRLWRAISTSIPMPVGRLFVFWPSTTSKSTCERDERTTNSTHNRASLTRFRHTGGDGSEDRSSDQSRLRTSSSMTFSSPASQP